MNNNASKISVIMSVYNGEKYIREAIDSILNQTYQDFEFIIVNDGSTDNSLEIIKSYTDFRIVVIVQENTGLSKALNNGIKQAKGEYIARMDADDISDPTRLENQYYFMERNPQVVVVGTWANIISKDGEYLYTMKRPTSSEELKKCLPESPFFHGSVMIRAIILKEIGGYKSMFRNRQDTILWIDLSEKGNFTNIEEPLYKFRITPNSNQRKTKKYIKLQDAVISKYYKYRIIDNDILSKMNRHGGGLSNRKKYSLYWLILGKIYIENRFNRYLAFKNILRSLLYDPFNIVALFNLLLLFLPKRWIMLWKKHRIN